ncbi:MAG: ABC transporter permease [Chloroflexota bacterium]
MIEVSDRSQNTITPPAKRKTAAKRKRAGWKEPHWGWSVVSLILFLIAWEAIVIWRDVAPFILPRPSAIMQSIWTLTLDGRLPRHMLITLAEVIPGLLLGSAVALPLGYLITKSKWAEKLVSPYLIATQAIPIIAIAPLLTIWVHSTYWSRVLVAVLVVFFPIMINVIVGLQSVSPDMLDLMRTLKATRWQIFRKLELPATLPVLLGGFKVAATLSVIGALVGEFVNPRSQGLGYLLLTARYQFKTDIVFAVLLTLAVLALSLYGLAALMERRLLRWKM